MMRFYQTSAIVAAILAVSVADSPVFRSVYAVLACLSLVCLNSCEKAKASKEPEPTPLDDDKWHHYVWRYRDPRFPPETWVDGTPDSSR